MLLAAIQQCTQSQVEDPRDLQNTPSPRAGRSGEVDLLSRLVF